MVGVRGWAVRGWAVMHAPTNAQQSTNQPNTNPQKHNTTTYVLGRVLAVGGLHQDVEGAHGQIVVGGLLLGVACSMFLFMVGRVLLLMFVVGFVGGGGGVKWIPPPPPSPQKRPLHTYMICTGTPLTPVCLRLAGYHGRRLGEGVVPRGGVRPVLHAPVHGVHDLLVWMCGSQCALRCLAIPSTDKKINTKT